MDKVIKADVLVIGGGQAGFFAALKAQEQGANVVMVDKGYAGKSGQSQNITCMIYFDPEKNDLDKWMEEGPIADEYLENRDWVEVVYRESKARWDDMGKWGMKSWRYDANGNAYLAPINGSDDERCPGEPEEDVITNYLIENRYHYKLRNIFTGQGGQIIDRVMVTDLIRQDGHIAGAVGFSPDHEDTYVFHAKSVVLAAGNCGIKTCGIRTNTTTGDAQAMAYRLGCALTGKEWADQHGSRGDYPAYPWTGNDRNPYYNKNDETCKTLAEHLPLYNAEGTKIDSIRPNLEKFHPLPFNAIAMAYEAHCGRAPLFYKVDGNPDTRPMNHNPGTQPRSAVDEAAAEQGLVRMSMGRAIGQSYHLSDGIWSDGLDCETQIPGLYAAGDCLGARSGYPMAGFAAAFCAVSGARAGTNAAKYAKAAADFSLDQAQVEQLKQTLWAPKQRTGGFSPAWAIQVIQNTVTPYWVLLYKSEARLQAALEYILFMKEHIVPQLIARDNHELRLAHEVQNIVLHVEMKLRASMFRKESRWYHYREDYPLRDDKNWLCWIKIQEIDGKMQLTKVPIPEQWRPDTTQPYAERYPCAFPNEPSVLPDGFLGVE